MSDIAKIGCLFFAVPLALIEGAILAYGGNVMGPLGVPRLLEALIALMFLVTGILIIRSILRER